MPSLLCCQNGSLSHMSLHLSTLCHHISALPTAGLWPSRLSTVISVSFFGLAPANRLPPALDNLNCHVSVLALCYSRVAGIDSVCCAQVRGSQRDATKGLASQCSSPSPVAIFFSPSSLPGKTSSSVINPRRSQNCPTPHDIWTTWALYSFSSQPFDEFV